jgi:putative two-component system response regulator
MQHAEPPAEFPKEGWIARLWHEQAAQYPSLHLHSQHVALVSSLVARELGWDEADILKCQVAGQFHDIGKLDVPREILDAPRRLTPEERQLIERHSILGGRRIRDLGATPVLSFVEDVALHHHERFDGNGYPDRLAGEAIGLPARVTAVGDVYSALWERRSYKDALSHDDVLARMVNGDERMSPAMFDPQVVRALRDASGAIRSALPA